MINPETKSALSKLMKDLEKESREEARQEAIRKGREKGKVIDQTELCYRQYSPPQVS